MRALVLLAAVVCASTAVAAADASLRPFLARFADIAAHGAADSMAKLTRFPLKNRVYQQPERISAGGFKHQFTLNHLREFADCLKTTPAQRSNGPSADLGDWAVDCNGNVFYFAQQGGDWRFTGFENINE